MGWDQVAELEVEKHQPADDGKPRLYSRGGLNGVVVTVEDKWIPIPRKVLFELVAQEYLNQEITRLECLEVEGILAEMGFNIDFKLMG